MTTRRSRLAMLLTVGASFALVSLPTCMAPDLPVPAPPADAATADGTLATPHELFVTNDTSDNWLFGVPQPGLGQLPIQGTQIRGKVTAVIQAWLPYKVWGKLTCPDSPSCPEASLLTALALRLPVPVLQVTTEKRLLSGKLGWEAWAENLTLYVEVGVCPALLEPTTQTWVPGTSTPSPPSLGKCVTKTSAMELRMLNLGAVPSVAVGDAVYLSYRNPLAQVDALGKPFHTDGSVLGLLRSVAGQVVVSDPWTQPPIVWTDAQVEAAAGLK